MKYGIMRRIISAAVSAAVLLSAASFCFAEDGAPQDATGDETEHVDMYFQEIPEGSKTDISEQAGAEADASATSRMLVVKSVNYNPGTSKVTFKFNQEVKYNKAKVTVRYKLGENKVSKITGKKSKSLTVKVSKLKYGRKYSYVIKGVKRAGSSVSVTLIGTFRAVN